MKSAISDSLLGHSIIRLKRVDSTQNFLMAHPQYLAQKGLIVLAEEQTAGRGRAGRHFIAPQGTLTFSLVLHPERPLDELQVYPLLAGLAIARTLAQLKIRNLRLKWPNDVLISGKKVCGILMENRMIPEQIFPVLLLGIGINCTGNTLDFPEDLRSRVTLLSEHTQENTDCEFVLSKILKSLAELLAQFDEEGPQELLQEWVKVAQIAQTPIRYKERSEWKEGRILGITEHGYLQVERNDGTHFQHVCGDIQYLDSP